MADLTTVATKLGREATTKFRSFAEHNSVAKKAKDVMFTAVGLGVLGAQKTTAAVKTVQSTVDTEGVSASVKKGVEEVTSTVKRQAVWVDAQVERTLKSIDEAVAPIEQKFPVAVRDAAAKVREVRTKARASFTARLNETTDSKEDVETSTEKAKADKK